MDGGMSLTGDRHPETTSQAYGPPLSYPFAHS